MAYLPVRLVILLAASLLPVAGCDVSDPAPAVLLDQFLLESSEATPTASRVVLQQDVDYAVVVEGTYSVWGPGEWGQVCVGETEAAPMYPSGSRGGPVGLDPAYAFAGPGGTVICDRGAPSERSGWLYRARAAADWTLGPTDAPYNPDHVYETMVRGAGERLEVLIREVDDFDDNYGQLQISIYGPPS